MLVEARATGYVYHANSDQLEVRALGSGSGDAVQPSPDQPSPVKANLLLSAKRKLVGVDLRGTKAGCVLMLGAHEDVDGQAEASVRVGLDGSGTLLGITIDGASKLIEAPATNAY
jgi:hypothetical protein